MRRITALLAASLILTISGCGNQTPPPTEAEQPAAAAQSDAPSIRMSNLPPITIGDFEVQPMYEEDLADGHFNLTITGGEIAAVREWVGPEDASGVVVVKTEIENGYYHGHIEMPAPVPADARLWVEIETPDGQRLKGSTPLNG